jgi:hypothetical protein
MMRSESEKHILFQLKFIIKIIAILYDIWKSES